MFLSGADATCFSMSQHLKIPTVRDIFYIITRLCSLPPITHIHAHAHKYKTVLTLTTFMRCVLTYSVLSCSVLFFHLKRTMTHRIQIDVWKEYPTLIPSANTFSFPSALQLHITYLAFKYICTYDYLTEEGKFLLKSEKEILRN